MRVIVIVVMLVSACAGSTTYKLATKTKVDSRHVEDCHKHGEIAACVRIAETLAGGTDEDVAWKYVAKICDEDYTGRYCLRVWKLAHSSAPSETEALQVLINACPTNPSVCMHLEQWHRERGHVAMATAYQIRTLQAEEYQDANREAFAERRAEEAEARRERRELARIQQEQERESDRMIFQAVMSGLEAIDLGVQDYNSKVAATHEIVRAAEEQRMRDRKTPVVVVAPPKADFRSSPKASGGRVSMQSSTPPPRAAATAPVQQRSAPAHGPPPPSTPLIPEPQGSPTLASNVVIPSRTSNPGGIRVTWQQSPARSNAPKPHRSVAEIHGGGMQRSRFCTSDGEIFLVYRTFRDASGGYSVGATVLDGPGGIYRLGSGDATIQPGCYEHYFEAGAWAMGDAFIKSIISYR